MNKWGVRMKSFRDKDTKAEQELAKFMDQFFYSKLRDKNKRPVNCRRVYDKTTQMKGIDIEMMVEDRTYYIDEKASLYYSNVMLPTFVLEIDSIQKNQREPVKGWFVNDNLMTDYYMLIWPNVKCQQDENKNWIRKSIESLTCNDFTIVEAMLIKKTDLVLEIQKCGYSTNRLIQYAMDLRHKANNQNNNISEKLNDEIKIQYSGKIAEKPINIVASKELLKRVAKAVYLISKDGYAKIS